MPDDPKAVERLRQLSARRAKAQATADARRDELYAEIVRAYESGDVSITGIARAMGVTRQRAQALVRHLSSR